MSLSATLFGRDSAIFKATNILGLGIPGWLDKKFGAKDLNIEGPRLSDLSVQTSTYGAPIPRLYGTIAVMGNLIWLENNRLKETVRKKKSSSGGKGGGGGSSEPTTTYSYSATFHLALCEGPIAGIRRIWCGDKLIYNAGSDDLETIIASNKAAKGWKLYLGTDDQLPDSRYEANVGVGNASANRGLAYLAFYDFQLADYSNTLQGSQFKVEIVALSITETNLLVNIEPQTVTAFGPRSGGGFRPDFYGLKFLDERLVGSATTSEVRLGGQRGIDEPIDGFGGSSIMLVRAAASFDGDVWWVDKIDDLFGSTRVTRQSDGATFNIYKEADVQFIRAPDETYCICLWTSAAVPGLLDGVARFYIGYGEDFGILLDSISCPAGYRISTAGDKIHAFSISGDSLLVNLYSDGLELESSYAVALPYAQWPNVNVPLSYGAGFEVLSCTLEGVLYLLHHDILNGYFRILSVSAGAILDNYVLPDGGSVELPYAFYMASPSQGYINTDRVIQFSAYASGGIPLSQVVKSEIKNSGLLGDLDIDSTQLTDVVRGYRITGGSVRSAIEPLQAAYPFDIISSGYQIRCISRGQESVITIPWEDLGSSDSSSDVDIFKQSREMDTQLPAKTTVQYLDAAREYAIGEQSSERINTEAINKIERQLSIVQTANEASSTAEILQNLAWLERSDIAFTLPPIYLNAEPSDVVTVTSSQAIHEIRLTEINTTQDGRLECKAKTNRAALYTSSATGSEGVPPVGNIPLAGASSFIPLDIPLLDESIQNTTGFVGVLVGDTSSWPGGIVVRSSDGGQTWQDIQAYTAQPTIGTARTTLSPSACTFVEQRPLIVDMLSGELESVTRDQMLSGANYAAYGVDGRWEVVRYQSANLNADGSYTLSGFIRGEKGTEWAAPIHEPGDLFVVLDDPDNAFIGMPVESIGLQRTYRGITSGESLDSASDEFFTYKGINLECLSPVYPKGLRDGSGNFTGTFTRRSRLSSSWWTTGVPAPIGEASESYEIDVMSGSVVKRTIFSSSPSFSYSSANQVSDFGSNQSSITFRIYQLSAIVGRGYPLETTL